MCFSPFEISTFFFLCTLSYSLNNIPSSQKFTLPQPLRRYKFIQGIMFIRTTIIVNNISWMHTPAEMSTLITGDRLTQSGPLNPTFYMSLKVIFHYTKVCSAPSLCHVKCVKTGYLQTAVNQALDNLATTITNFSICTVPHPRRRHSFFIIFHSLSF
jgi:hypothetical protein